jgi:hypothetical protein
MKKDTAEYNYNLGYLKALEEVEKMINRISDLNFTKPIKKRLKEELNKLKEEK